METSSCCTEEVGLAAGLLHTCRKLITVLALEPHSTFRDAAFMVAILCRWSVLYCRFARLALSSPSHVSLTYAVCAEDYHKVILCVPAGLH